MANFTAYFDASGHPSDSRWMFVSGFVAKDEVWLRFDKEWQEFLHRYGIESPFHMTDFVAARGQFSSWRGNQEKQEKCLQDAMKVMRRNTRKSFGYGIEIALLRKLAREFPEASSSALEPYTWCGLGVLPQVFRWAKRHMPLTSRFPTMVFEQGDRDHGQMAKEMKKMYGVNPDFRMKHECLPFQIADIVAWEHRRARTDLSKNPDEFSPRDFFRALYRSVPNEWVIQDFDGAREVLIRRLEKSATPNEELVAEAP